jgi:hypothetical protein
MRYNKVKEAGGYPLLAALTCPAYSGASDKGSQPREDTLRSPFNIM